VIATAGVIYALLDDRSGEVRYIGKTLIKPSTRLGQHRRDVADTHKARWVRSIGPEHVQIKVLEAAERTRLCDLEREWIARLRADGVRLTNLTPGGEGGPGAKPGAANPMKRPEVVAKIVAVPRRRDDLWKARISMARKGQRVSEETKAKISASLSGVPKSAKHNAAVSVAQRERNARMTPEQRSEITRKRYDWITPEARSESARKGHETRRRKAMGVL
jgi:hypothetical protein